MAQTTGYSNTPLAKKLGIKSGNKIMLVNQPPYYFDLFTDLPINIELMNDPLIKKDFIHLFTTNEAEFKIILPQLKSQIQPNGVVWVSWPKKTSKVETDITESIIRNYAINIGLVDIKICAIDQIWSALKFVIPVKDR